jgi:hypothetical protein
MISYSLPLFPLPSVVLFPNVFLPLHIFEERYRQMTAEALAGDRMIGMVLLKPGYGADYDGAPAIYGIGCAGLITHADRMEDGRYNLVLRGLEKFSIEQEEPPAPGRPYRTAVVSSIPDTLAADERLAMPAQRRKLETLLAPLFPTALEHSLPPTMPDEDLVNALSQYLAFEPLEKLALLERSGPLARSQSLIELLEMKSLVKAGPGDAGTVH